MYKYYTHRDITMAAKKTLDFLPGIFQTDTNKKFLSATLDQLISEPNLTNIHGYIGRTFAPTYKPHDSYVVEPTNNRQNYQLEPSIVVRDSNNEIVSFAGYDDLLNTIDHNNGLTNNHSRLFDSEYYSYDPKISFDMFVNFSQYHWIKGGLPPVAVNTTGVELVKTFIVTKNTATDQYEFTSNGATSHALTLSRGGTYTFNIAQTDTTFWVQSEPGTDGFLNATPSISTRDVYGVSNNGSHTITINVPQITAQDRFTSMATVANIDYAIPLAYSALHNRTVSSFLAANPAYNGLSNQLVGKTIVFVDQNLLTNVGDAAWTGITDHVLVPTSQRYGVWKITFVNNTLADPVIKLVFVSNINLNKKVYINTGFNYAGREFYKEYDEFLHIIAPLTSIQPYLYFQDSIDTSMYGSIKIVDAVTWAIDVDMDIIGHATYLSQNGAQFTNGLKVSFGTDVTPASYQNKTYYVEGVGTAIQLVDVALMVTPELYNDELTLNYPTTAFPDYITINRTSKDLNAWSRNNHWVHRDVITATATYNDTLAVYDQLTRAQRPIIQFEGNLQLFNNGRVGKQQVDVIDTTTRDAFNELEGKTYTTAFGVTLYTGLRVILANDIDPLVRNNVYTVNLIQTAVTSQGLPTGDITIKLELATDYISEKYNTVVVTGGSYKGTQWWNDGVQWKQSQQKTELQQAPLFDVFDKSGNSLSTYTRSTFAGTQLFGYKRKTTGIADTILGFALSYRNFGTQGDIEFQNYFDTDTYTYIIGQDLITPAVSTGTINEIIDISTVQSRNTWIPVVETSKQYQLISYTYNENALPFLIDVTPAAQVSIPYTKVYKNNKFLPTTQWSLVNNEIVLTTLPIIGDKIDILVYSADTSALGFYQVPKNLDLNAQNLTVTTLTLGQLRNHFVELGNNSASLVGDIIGSSNVRDLYIIAQGGNILQHSAPAAYSTLFLLDETANFNNATRLAQQEYTRFKNKFLESSITLAGIDPTNSAASVDLILTSINDIKNKTFPWYYSDMVPYGPLINTIEYVVFDPFVRSYEITNIFDNTTLSNKAILVYHNNMQLIIGKDYVINTDHPAITFTDSVILEIDDVIKFVEYSDTDGNYIPETPTKLGLYPKSVPELFLDDTYRTPINVIRGHDGSITPAFNDYRDNFLLELESRIYNNIKDFDGIVYNAVYGVMPGKFRNSDYNINEINQLLSSNFLTWVGNNKIDYTLNSTFNSNDPFTWNYSSFTDRINGETLPGSWKACFQYFFDTIRPHLTPWEMLGFASKPLWWEENYGPAPYTGGNALLWDDLAAGRIVAGERAGIDLNFARPGLTKIIPVDANGNLLSPAAFLSASYNAKYAATAWSIGEYGPVESAWRNSSDFPFAIQHALAYAEPGKYFSQLMDVSRFKYNTALGQYVTSTGHHLQQTDLTFNGDTSSGTTIRVAGYLNWIADYLTNLGISPSTKITPMLANYKVNLAYKLAGFSDQKYLQVLAEQSSPTSTNDSIIIPDENYNIYLHKSAPVLKMVYSSVIVEKTDNGYSVRGYNLANPYFEIIPSIVNNNAYKIKVLNSDAVVYGDYEQLKLTIPYGYEVKSQQQLVDFLISYERFLMSQGFTFNDVDEQLGESRNWKLSVKEFLFWAQQGWKTGSILVLSPVSDTLNAISIGAIADGITDTQHGSKILDQNFKMVKNNNYNVMRSPTEFKITLTSDAVIGYVEIDLVQYDHVLVFDNTTVFSDIIYKPELGNRQYRLKLIGQKTAEWDGSLNAPGFIYNAGVVASWLQGKDYLKGDLIEFKNRYYTALQNSIAATEFNFTEWKQIPKGDIKKGLLPNFATIATNAKSYYDSYGYFNSSGQVKYSHGLIGFSPRRYLDDLGLNETTQIELYKGFIKQKGSANAVTKLSNAEFANLNSAIEFYEEWAVRVGEYGSISTNPYVEIVLNERAFGVNPALAGFVDKVHNLDGNGVTTFNKLQLYKSTEEFVGNIAMNRDNHSDYDNDMPTAGYVNINDVSTTLFNLANYADLNSQIHKVGSGFTIWTAKDFTQNWNVFRISESNNHITSVANSLDGMVTFTSDMPHGLTVDDVFMVRNFDVAFDGFYKVHKLVDLNNVMVTYAGDTRTLSTLSGNGILFTLDSVRFTYMEDARKYTPAHGWKTGEKIWIDIDAATTLAQGQAYVTENNTWKVYEKTMPWALKQNLIKGETEYVANAGYGAAIRLSANGMLAVASTPGVVTSTRDGVNNTGVVNTFVRNFDDNFVQSFSITPNGNDTYEFGYAVDLATSTLGVTAPGSRGNIGLVYIYTKDSDNATFKRSQIVTGNILATGDRLGSSMSFDETGKWMYVGAPGNDRVYVYGLNEHVTPRSIIASVNNQNILTLSGNITANIGDVITQASSGAYVSVVGAPVYTAGNATVKVSSLSNFFIGTGALTVNQVNLYGSIIGANVTAVYPIATTSSSITNSIGLSFTPDVANDANSLLVTSRDRTYIPGVDYTLSGMTLQFTGNIAENDISIEQKPYYTLVTTLQGTSGSGFGTAIDASWDGAQLAVGVPNKTVNGLIGAGAVYVYDRVIEAFNSTGQQDYTTIGNIGLAHRVTIDEVDTTDYIVIGSNIIRFITPPLSGHMIHIETNQINQLETLTGDAVQTGAHFGSALTVCSNNCAIYVGAPYYDNGAAYNTGAVFKFHNRGRLYGSNTGTIKNPTFTPGHTIRLDNFLVTATGVSLDSLVHDINAAGILGVSAVNAGGYLRLQSDRTVVKNLMRILSGTGTILANAGLAVFAEMQIIVNPFNASYEYFGSKVVLASNASMLVISSENGTTHTRTIFDTSSTTLDATTTAFTDPIVGSGSVYIYELYDDPRDAIEHPGRYSFCQQLTTSQLSPTDKFGHAIDIVGKYIMTSAPNDGTKVLNGGSLYIFENVTRHRGWNLTQYQQPTVDVDSVNRMFIYNNALNTIQSNLEFIDPAKGKILGQAEQEISYKTEYDPAMYSKGTNPEVTLSSMIYWNDAQKGQVWWNLSKVRYIDYEQSSNTYRSINWGLAFPGSEIEVLEWAESDVLPSQYVKAGYEGTPKHADNSAYVEINYVNPVTNIVGSKFYFWIKNKTSIVDTNNIRRLPLITIQEMIANPKSNGVAYAAVIRNNAVILYNAAQHLSANEAILHIDYETVKNTNIIHSEYELIQKGNLNSTLPARIADKLIDSISGIDITGAVVPDPRLSLADRYGTGIRPRQSMIINRSAAVSEMVAFANSALINTAVAKQADLTRLHAEEAIPAVDSGEYNQIVGSELDLAYIDTTGMAIGYLILVQNDTTQDGLWSIYMLLAGGNWKLHGLQGYKTSLYWNYADWYAAGYSATDKATFVAATLVDALKLSYAPGDMIKITNTGNGEWQLVLINPDYSFETIGIQNGTIQLSSLLSNLAANNLGFSNQGFDSARYDQNPNIEIRQILNALRYDLFTNELQGKFNDLFFVMLNYIFVEQKYVDWIFKTSFISVTHQLRQLNQAPNYVKDNQTYYQDYINEVKPYATKIREYLINYNTVDNYAGSLTDFDLPSYYDTDTKMFRSPSGENAVKDSALWQTTQYREWYNNRNLTVDSISIEDGGAGYLTIPSVTLVGTTATARAIIDYNTGAVTSIVITKSGTGASGTVQVVINGSNTHPARAYALLKNNQVRSFDMTLKFDRVSYTSVVTDWAENTAYTTGHIVSYNGTGYVVNANVTTGSSFVGADYTIYSSANFNNANDRIMSYYRPTSTMPAKDLKQLVYGVEYPGVQITGLGFSQQPGMDITGFDATLFDNVQYDENGVAMIDNSAIDTLIRSTYVDLLLGTRPEDINIDGGAYIDKFSSHAPAELVPGIVFDTLDMKVFTKLSNATVTSTNIAGYRIFNDMVHTTSYLRIAAANTTTLAANLTLTATTISVVDASKLATPSPTLSIPGVVFIGSERITYFGINLLTNTLSQIRRGTAGTGTIATHYVGESIVDGSLNQVMPGTVNAGNVAISSALFNNVGGSTASDGTGLAGSTTLGANFLKSALAV